MAFFTCSASSDPIEQVNLEIATRIRHRDKPGRPMQKKKSQRKRKKEEKILFFENSQLWSSVLHGRFGRVGLQEVGL